MPFHDSLRRFVLLALLVAAACQTPVKRDDHASVTSVTTASIGADDTPGDQEYRRRVCARGVKQCSAEQEGQQCNPNDPLFLCLRQDNGGFCCLAFAN
jgi:hypothetical protein